MAVVCGRFHLLTRRSQARPFQTDTPTSITKPTRRGGLFHCKAQMVLASWLGSRERFFTFLVRECTENLVGRWRASFCQPPDPLHGTRVLLRSPELRLAPEAACHFLAPQNTPSESAPTLSWQISVYDTG
jgi:hypothetical protein